MCVSQQRLATHCSNLRSTFGARSTADIRGFGLVASCASGSVSRSAGVSVTRPVALHACLSVSSGILERRSAKHLPQTGPDGTGQQRTVIFEWVHVRRFGGEPYLCPHLFHFEPSNMTRALRPPCCSDRVACGARRLHEVVLLRADSEAM